MSGRLLRGLTSLALVVLIIPGGSVNAVKKNSSPVFKQVSAGLFHTCAISVGGELFCWGSNAYGQLGTGDESSSTAPRAVVGDIGSAEVVDVAAGDYHTCAVTFVGDLYCWGANFNYLLGIGNAELFSSSTPMLINVGAFENASAKAVSIDSFNTCAITSNDQVACWGSNIYGQTGRVASDANVSTPRLVVNGAMSGRTVSSVSVGGDRACAVTDRERVVCWGRSLYYAQTTGEWVSSHRPRVQNLGMFRGVDMTSVRSNFHSCGITKEKQLGCWGYNESGQIGNNTLIEQHEPIRVNKGSIRGKFVDSVSLSYGFSCAITTEQKLSCWGLNDKGQLGDNSVSNRIKPIRIWTGALKDQLVSSVSAGQYHTCAITTVGSVACWGFNNQGQLGDGTNTNRLRPVNVMWLG